MSQHRNSRRASRPPAAPKNLDDTRKDVRRLASEILNRTEFLGQVEDPRTRTQILRRVEDLLAAARRL